MAINPHRKGGPDIPVADGGTSASAAAAALSNLGGLDTTAHSSIDHASLPGVADSAATPRIIHQSNPDLPIANAQNPGGYNLVIPAATLTTDAEELYIKVVLETSNAGAESLNVSFGGVSLLATANFGATAPISYVVFHYRLYRTGATMARFIGIHEGPMDVPTTTKSSTAVSYVGGNNLALTWANPLTFNVTNVAATVSNVRSVQVVKYPQVP